MTPYVWAWLIIVAAVPLALFALHRATRNFALPRTRRVVLALLAVWLLLPAPVPGHAGHFAPAFLVFAFESLFQRPGQPRTAGIILAAGGLLAVAVMLLAALRRRSDDPDT